MNEVVLSIIVPSYNSKKYILECLRSVFSQIVENIEVILIDDGSTDGGARLVKLEFKNEIMNRSLVMIRQDNLGPGAARNRGVSLAKGRYITFLDSDDLILNGYFETILPLVSGCVADVIEHGFIRFPSIVELPDAKFSPLYKFSGLYELNEIRNKLFSRTVWYPSIRVYKREFWSQLRYPEGVCYEDPATIHKIFLKSGLIYFTGTPLLGYRLNPVSITSNHSKGHLLDLINLYWSMSSGRISKKIFKIRLARTILYFYHELDCLDEPVSQVLTDVKSMAKPRLWLLNLKFSDLIFIVFTKTYIRLNKRRINRVSKSKIKELVK